MKAIWLLVLTSFLGLVLGNSLTCMVSDGWVKRNADGLCYKGFKDQMEKFQDANEICKTHNDGYLTSVKDISQYFFIAGEILEAANTKFWVGLYKSGNDYYWYDDNSLYDGSYGRVSSGPQSCYNAINTRSGLWYSKACDSQSIAFVVCTTQPSCIRDSNDWRCANVSTTPGSIPTPINQGPPLTSPADPTATAAITLATFTTKTSREMQTITKQILTTTTINVPAAATTAQSPTKAATESLKANTKEDSTSTTASIPIDSRVTRLQTTVTQPELKLTTPLIKQPEINSDTPSLNKGTLDKQKQEKEETKRRNIAIGGSILAVILVILIVIAIAFFLKKHQPTIHVSVISPAPDPRAPVILRQSRSSLGRRPPSPEINQLPNLESVEEGIYAAKMDSADSKQPRLSIQPNTGTNSA